MTSVSRTAAGSATPRIFFMSFAEKESPMPNMRKTTPSWPIVFVEERSRRKLPPHVCGLMTTPARM